MNAPRGILVDLALALLLCLGALAVRWPMVHTIPRYTDETGEVATALAIAFEGARPLVHNDAYRGPFWAYLLGGVFALTGPAPGVPRLFTLALGVLTVGATYALARALAGRAAGLVAGLLMATAFGPVVLGSHVAWSNHSTPLWTTLAALTLWLGAGSAVNTNPDAPSPSRWGRGLGGGGRPARQTQAVDPSDPTPAIPPRRADAWLILSGLLWGLALQTHPSVIALLPGALLWFVAASDRRRRLRTPGPWIAASVFVLVLSPMIVYNVQNSLASVAEATKPSQPIVRELGPAVWLTNGVALAGQLGRAAGAGPLLEPGDPVPNAVTAASDALRPVTTWAYVLALFGALAWTGWRGPQLPAFLAGSTVLILPLINRSYTNFYDSRYLAMLLPQAYAAVGAIAGPWLAAADRRAAPRFAVAAILAALILYPLVALWGFYAREYAAGRTNHAMIAAADLVAAADTGGGRTVLVDKAMRPLKLGGGGDPTRAFDELLTLRQVDHQLADIDKIRWFVQNDTAASIWIVAADATAAQLVAEGRERGMAPAVQAYLRDLAPPCAFVTRAEAQGWTLLELRREGCP